MKTTGSKRVYATSHDSLGILGVDKHTDRRDNPRRRSFTEFASLVFLPLGVCICRARDLKRRQLDVIGRRWREVTSTLGGALRNFPRRSRRWWVIVAKKPVPLQPPPSKLAHTQQSEREKGPSPGSGHGPPSRNLLFRGTRGVHVAHLESPLLTY